MKIRIVAAICFVIMCLSCGLSAQTPCSAPVLATSKGFNMFTQEQDVTLGEVFAESTAIEYRVIEDPAVTTYLQAVGDRIAKKFPPNKLQFRFYIIDAPYANAFAFPGGRIYFTRKMISLFKSEDEMAGVLGHEMGHQVARHGALDWSQRFRDISKVSSVKSRNDMEDAYHKFLDTYRKNPGLLNNGDRVNKEQLQADEVAVYATAQAGYDPQAVVTFWDRFTETKGKKGSWFSDAFGSTLPEMKRLREFVNNVGKLPEACVEKSQAPSTSEFTKWQLAVRTYSGFGKKMAVSNLERKHELSPQLRSDINFFRFSGDGKYLIAQDDASIFVLSREPFKTLFRIDAEDAYSAMFSPDNKEVVFYTTGLRVERWNIATQSMEEADEIHTFRSCRQTELSPDGKVMACLEPDRETFFPMELALIDVQKGEPFFSKKEFIGPVNGMQYEQYANTYRTYVALRHWRGDIINMHFSPDAHYFLAGNKTVNLGFDLTAKTQMSLAGSVKKTLGKNFAFMGPDRIIGVEGDQGEDSVVLTFPKGDTVMQKLAIGNRSVVAPGGGDYALVRPLLKAPVGILDLKQNKLTIGSRTDALDIYNGTYVSERKSGELGLYTDPTKGPIATTQLPPAPLSRLRAHSMSPDDKMLAVSDRKRGAVWNLQTGEQLLFLRGFRGADFDNQTVSLDFPPADDYDSPGAAKQKAKEIEKERREKPGHSIAHFDLASGAVTEGDKFQQKHRVSTVGKWVVIINSGKDDEDDFRKNVLIQVKNVRTGQEAWTRTFAKGLPRTYFDPRSELILFAYELDQGEAKDAMKGDDETKHKADAILNQENSLLIEIVDITTGKVRSRFPVDTGKGSFRLQDALVMNDHIYFSDNFNRVLVYSAKGELLGRYFGDLQAVSRDNKHMLLQTERGRLAVFDTATRAKLDVYTFESPVGFAEFSADGKKMFVMTRDQKLFTVAVPETTASKTN